MLSYLYKLVKMPSVCVSVCVDVNQGAIIYTIIAISDKKAFLANICVSYMW